MPAEHLHAMNLHKKEKLKREKPKPKAEYPFFSSYQNLWVIYRDRHFWRTVCYSGSRFNRNRDSFEGIKPLCEGPLAPSQHVAFQRLLGFRKHDQAVLAKVNDYLELRDRDGCRESLIKVLPPIETEPFIRGVPDIPKECS